MKTLVLASNNIHKIKEFKEILEDYEILSLKDIGFLEDIVEDGNSFLENALIKAKTVSQFLQENNLFYDVVADDSGLCCNALNGEPGIYSARYGDDHNFQSCRDKLRDNLREKEDKSAYFTCCIVYYPIHGNYSSFEGKTMGVVIDEERGNKDFGYDCIFYSDDLHKTFGEATSEEKNQVSHRRRAIEELKKSL